VSGGSASAAADGGGDASGTALDAAGGAASALGAADALGSLAGRALREIAGAAPPAAGASVVLACTPECRSAQPTVEVKKISAETEAESSERMRRYSDSCEL
jgi:hypothetical protein